MEVERDGERERDDQEEKKREEKGKYKSIAQRALEGTSPAEELKVGKSH